MNVLIWVFASPSVCIARQEHYYEMSQQKLIVFGSLLFIIDTL